MDYSSSMCHCAQIRIQWADFKQFTYDSDITVQSIMPLSNYILRLQGYVDQMKGHPSKPKLTKSILTPYSMKDIQLYEYDCTGTSTMDQVSHANLKAKLFQQEKYLPILSSDSAVANRATSIFVYLQVQQVFPVSVLRRL